MNKELFIDVVQYLTTAVGILGALVAVFGAVKSGTLRVFRKGVTQASKKDTEHMMAFIKAIAEPTREKTKREEEQLAQFYAQVLFQSKVSYWWGLAFASVGVLVIMIAAVMHATAHVSVLAAEALAGMVMGSLGVLVLKHSRNAEVVWRDFFQQLHKDRKQSDARLMCESIRDSHSQDSLKIILALHFAGIEKGDEISKTIFQPLLGAKTAGQAAEN